MVVVGLLPIAALALAILAVFQRTGKFSTSVLVGGLTWSFGLALATEALSFANAIAFLPVLLAWTLAIAITLSLIVSGALPPGSMRPTAPAAAPTVFERTVAVVLLVIAAVTLVIALNCPPNNWDSQTYHLARIEHWIQNRSLAFYPTANDRQLVYQNLAEVAVLQLRLLSGGDRLDNLIQWLAGVGSVVAVGEIAIALGATRSGAMLARLTAATLPIGILESTSTQNDLVVAFFLLCTAERLLVWRRTRLPRDAAFMAVAAGLALAAKGTAYVIGAPIGVWFLIELFPMRRQTIAVLACCALLVLLPNVPAYLRSFSYSGSPVTDRDPSISNAVLGPRAFLLNAVRNAAVDLATVDAGLDQRMTAFVVEGLAALGVDANAANATFGNQKFELERYQTDEDYAGNPLQLLLGAIAVGFALVAGDKAKLRRRYAFCFAAQVFLFIAVLRWQPWITRLQLPLFALSAPLTAVLPLFRGRGWPAAILGILLVVWASPALFLNRTRAFVGLPGFSESFWSKTPEQILFAKKPSLQQQYQAAVDFVARRSNHEIGLMIGADDWEYPIWRLLRQVEARNLRIEHIGLTGRSGTMPYPLGAFSPTVLMVMSGNRPVQVIVDGRAFRKAMEMPALAIYEVQR